MGDAVTGDDELEIEARLSLALARVNRRLEDQEIALLRDRIARNVMLAQRLSAVPLGNSDEPAHNVTLSGGPGGGEDERP